jgi:hypothetical protein
MISLRSEYHLLYLYALDFKELVFEFQGFFAVAGKFEKYESAGAAMVVNYFVQPESCFDGASKFRECRLYLEGGSSPVADINPKYSYFVHG